MSFAVVDPDAAARVAQWICEHRPASWSKCPPELKNLQGTLNRLCNWKKPSISETELSTMANLLGSAGEFVLMSQLYGAILSPDACNAYVDYLRWAHGMAARFWRVPRRSIYVMSTPGPRRVNQLGDTQVTPGDVLEILEAYEGVFYETRKPEDISEAEHARGERLGQVLRHVFSDPGCKSELDSFANWAREKGHEPPRIEMARSRVVEPLVEAAEGGFIERDVTELEPDELRRFVKAGFDRERILLNRAANFIRAQQVYHADAAQ